MSECVSECASECVSECMLTRPHPLFPTNDRCTAPAQKVRDNINKPLPPPLPLPHPTPPLPRRHQHGAVGGLRARATQHQRVLHRPQNRRQHQAHPRQHLRRQRRKARVRPTINLLIFRSLLSVLEREMSLEIFLSRT